jgi:uncharacterized membrane protein YdbT with pleckstrin-like domain
MAEETIWTGRASQWKNFSVFLFCAVIGVAIVTAAVAVPPGPFLLPLLIFPAGWAFFRWLRVRSRVYRLTSERLLIESGILNKTTETLELYRVKDFQVAQPFSHRFVGLQNIHLLTSDASTPEVIIDAVPSSQNLGDKFRECIEQCRVTKRVREVEIE